MFVNKPMAVFATVGEVALGYHPEPAETLAPFLLEQLAVSRFVSMVAGKLYPAVVGFPVALPPPVLHKE